jgi:hypothetical protein
MRKAVMPFVLSVGLIAVWAAPADAASTRAEYIGQVDPICQSFVAPLEGAFGAVNRNFNRMVRAAKANKSKAFVRGIRRTSSALNGLAGVHANMIAQLAVVPPAPADSGTVGSWLGYLRQEEGFEQGAASSLAVFKIRPFFRQLRQADQALRSGQAAIAGFGFQVCGVAVF